MQGAECCAKRAKARVPVVVRQFGAVVTEFNASSRMILLLHQCRTRSVP
jgi:hypothetical protein